MHIVIKIILLGIFSGPAIFGQSDFHVTSVKGKTPIENSITIEFRLTPADLKDPEKAVMYFLPVEYVGEVERKKQVLKAEGSNLKLTIHADKPVYLFTDEMFKNRNHYWLGEPGDQVVISSIGKRLLFSGKGAEKFRLQYLVDSIRKAIPLPTNKSDNKTNSLEDFFEWNDYLHRKLAILLQLADSYKEKITPFAYDFIRSGLIDKIIDERSDKFGSLMSYGKKNGLTSKNLCDIYDSIYLPATEKLFQITSSKIYGNYRPIQYKFFRKYLFDRSRDPLNSRLKINLLTLEGGLETYKGLLREKFILDYFSDEFIKSMGFIPETETFLDKYYGEPGYPEYKEQMRKIELEERERLNEKGAPGFTLVDTKNNLFTKDSLKSKMTVADFWFTGCAGCTQMVPALQKMEDKFKGDSNILFLSISVDKNREQWLKSIAQKKYTTGRGTNLYTGGEGADHDMIRKFAIDGYPAIWLIDRYGRIIRTYPKPDPRRNDGKDMTELLQKQLAYFQDGPYIIHQGDSSKAYFVNGNTVSENVFDRSNPPSFNVQTDKGNVFPVLLKKTLQTEASEFEMPEKLVVLSDIEGNFDSFRKLLQVNKVIDDNYNWIFDKGHLVFAGDMFDRGQQVNECLWLMYSLEEKAKAAGGYVHFILGNHEIMNLEGDNRYAQQKYHDNAVMINKSLRDLYAGNTELGAWLRTKNVIEKIGDLLFVHGGMAKEFSDSVALSIRNINETVRKYAGDTVDYQHHPDKNVRFIFSSSYSPFWFRGYYGNGDKRLFSSTDTSFKWTVEKPDETEISAILRRWGVNKIITGHTIVGDTIGVYYNGRVINTDTKHAEGKGEALVIEKNLYYRADILGNKRELFNTSAARFENK